MAYTRRNIIDGLTVMNKDLYDNLQDGIEEAKISIANAVKLHDDLEKKFDNYVQAEALPKEVKTVVLNDILVVE